MRKILILGGSYFQIPAIKYAKSHGYYVITCDYLPDNSGHRLSDEYHNVSTTDKEAVLVLARSLNVDGILCFASDPAAPTAAYVSEKMGLPGNSYENVCTLGEKHLWRQFLKKNGFNVPKAKSYKSIEDVDLSDWEYPVMVKPIDSSGSKGVTKVCCSEDIVSAFKYALSYSRAKMVIIEDFVEKVGSQIGGDGFYGTDRLDFVCYGEQVVDSSVNPYVPCGMKFPANISREMADKISKEIERAISLSGLKNLSFNLEVMIDKAGKIFLMEIGPRNGGNCIPEVIQQYTGVDMVALAVEAAMGNDISICRHENQSFYAYYALHSVKKGIYQGYEISADFKGSIIASYIFIKQGDEIGAFNGSNQTIGILIMKFSNRRDIDDFFESSMAYIKVLVV